MEAILMRAGSFMAVIILGYVLKKVGFFKEEEFLCYVKDHGEDHTSCIHHCQFLTDKMSHPCFTMPV